MLSTSIRIFLIFLASLILNQVQGQQKVSFVAARNGLIVRESPNTSSPRTGILPFNEVVTIKEELQLDTINYRIAKWCWIRSDSLNIEGYVFGGYLNHLPLPKAEYSSLRMYIWTLLVEFDIQYQTEYTGNPSTKFSDRNVKIQGSDKHLLIHEFGYEWEIIELNLYDWKLYEVINLIELATWFGEDREYQVFIESINSNSLEEFRWINGFDDPEGEMVIQKRHPRGVRIIESSSL